MRRPEPGRKLTNGELRSMIGKEVVFVPRKCGSCGNYHSQAEKPVLATVLGTDVDGDLSIEYRLDGNSYQENLWGHYPDDSYDGRFYAQKSVTFGEVENLWG